MTLKDTQDLIDSTHIALLEDFRTIHHREPNGKELFIHLKYVLKEGYQEDILAEVLADNINCPQDYYKLLLLVASSK
jgi:hypothetical protein